MALSLINLVMSLVLWTPFRGKAIINNEVEVDDGDKIKRWHQGMKKMFDYEQKW